MRTLRSLLALSWLALAGCGGTPQEIADPPTGSRTETPTTTAQPDPPAVALPPSAEQTAEARRSCCEAAATAITQAQQNDILLNISDSRTVLELAEVLEETADAVETIQPPAASLGPLHSLLGKYAGTSRSMARALAATADANSVEARQQPLGQFRQLEPQLQVVIEEIGAYCNAAD